MIPNKQRKNYSQDLKDAIEEFARRKDKPHVIEEFFCGSDRQSLTVDLLHIVPLPLLSIHSFLILSHVMETIMKVNGNQTRAQPQLPSLSVSPSQYSLALTSSFPISCYSLNSLSCYLHRMVWERDFNRGT